MLKKILELIDKQETTSMEELAKKMGKEVSALDQPLRTLIQKGYLKTIDTGPVETKSIMCAGCNLAEICGGRNISKAFTVTPEGKKYYKDKK